MKVKQRFFKLKNLTHGIFHEVSIIFIVCENWTENSCLFWVLNDERFACNFDLAYLSKIYRYKLDYKSGGSY